MQRSIIASRFCVRRPLGCGAALLACLLVVLLHAAADAANTDPTFALTQATAARSATDRVTVVLEGSFGVADAVQLALPLEIVVTQGSRSARFDLAGNVSLSLDGGPPQAAPPPGVLGITERTITVALPVGFTAGEATAQIVGTYDGEAIASNQLRFSL